MTRDGRLRRQGIESDLTVNPDSRRSKMCSHRLEEIATDAARYEADPVTGCWNWKGARSKSGHGVVRVGVHVLLAHRAFYSFFVGPILPHLIVHHECRNAGCVNPRHLQVVTRTQHNRIHAGENGKLTTEKVEEIRTLWLKGTLNQTQLGTMYGVDHSTISLVVRNKTWTIAGHALQVAA